MKIFLIMDHLNMMIIQFITGKCLMGKSMDMESRLMKMEEYMKGFGTRIRNTPMEEVYFLRWKKVEVE